MKKEKKEKSKESKEKNGIIKKSNKKNKKTKFVKPDDVIYDQVFFYYFESQLEQLMVEKLKARKKHRNRFCSTEMVN